MHQAVAKYPPREEDYYFVFSIPHGCGAKQESGPVLASRLTIYYTKTKTQIVK